VRIRDEIDYGYAVGRVRVLEGRLLSRATYERLLDAPDVREQRRILAETHLGRYLEGVETAAQIERALDASLADLYAEFLEGAGLPQPVVRYFQVPYDFANARALAKARVLGMPFDHAPSPLGSVPPEAFVQGPAALPDSLAELVTRWDEAEEPPALDQVEAAVDRALFGALLAEARASRVRFLRDLTRLRIDVANARLLLRARAKALPVAQVSERLIEGGSHALEALAADAARMTAEELAEAIVRSRALGHLTDAELVDFEHFDLAADRLVAERMLAARRIPNGPEPVLAYVLAREGETLAVRTIVLGRLSGLDRDVLRARIRERV
jgi:V/A-type H+-transporting ATPase subunit C